MTLINSEPEPVIRSHDTGQRIPCFDRCQLTMTWMSNIKDVHVHCKLAGDKFLSIDSLNLSPRYGHVILVTLAYMEGWMVSHTAV